MAPVDEDLAQYVDGEQGILTVRASKTHRGWNGIRYKTGLSAKNVGSKKLSMNVATIPPGGVAYAHIHVDFEVMLYIIQGRVRHEYGPGCSLSIDNEAGVADRARAHVGAAQARAEVERYAEDADPHNRPAAAA